MSDNGDLKDDVPMPEGETGDKITKLFKTDEKDTSEPTRTQPFLSDPLHSTLYPAA